MNKLYDLRFVIGVFFLTIGLLLMVYSLFTAGEQGHKINLYCGGLLFLFGFGMVFFSARKKKE